MRTKQDCMWSIMAMIPYRRSNTTILKDTYTLSWRWPSKVSNNVPKSHQTYIQMQPGRLRMRRSSVCVLSPVRNVFSLIGLTAHMVLHTWYTFPWVRPFKRSVFPPTEIIFRKFAYEPRSRPSLLHFQMLSSSLVLILAASLTLALNDGLARTPPMGWNPYNAFR